MCVSSFRFFCFFSSLFCRIHSFRCSGGIAHSRTQPKDTNERTNRISFRTMCWALTLSLRIEIQFRRIEDACSRREESYQTKRIRSTNCRARANIKFDFVKLKNKLHDGRKRCTKEAVKKSKKAAKKTRNRLRNQIEEQTWKAVSGDTIVSTRTIFFVGSVLGPRRRFFFLCSLPCRFPFALSVCFRVCVHIKWLQAFSICR